MDPTTITAIQTAALQTPRFLLRTFHATAGGKQGLTTPLQITVGEARLGAAWEGRRRRVSARAQEGKAEGVLRTGELGLAADQGGHGGRGDGGGEGEDGEETHVGR